MNILEAVIKVRNELKAWVIENLVNKIDKNNPVMTGTISVNRAADTDAANYSSAIGENNEASGEASFAEGVFTEATGKGSHAEGIETTAVGEAAHAGGNGSVANGINSFAHGNKVIANTNNQHVRGKYNVADTESRYADIIGNGESDEERSNAHTVDWDGNAWFAGDVYVGGTGQDDGYKLAKASEVENVKNTYLPLAGGDLDCDISLKEGAVVAPDIKAKTKVSIKDYNSVDYAVIEYNSDDHGIDFRSQLDYDGERISVRVGEPTKEGHATTKKYVDGEVEKRFPLEGTGTVEGAVLTGYLTANAGVPVNYMDSETGGIYTMTAERIENVPVFGFYELETGNPVIIKNIAVPIEDNHAVNKKYVDDALAEKKIDGTGDIVVTLEDGYEYEYTGVTSLSMTVADGKAMGTIAFSVSADPTAIEVNGVVSTIGDDINDAKAGETWEFNCSDYKMIWRNWGIITS